MFSARVRNAFTARVFLVAAALLGCTAEQRIVPSPSPIAATATPQPTRTAGLALQALEQTSVDGLVPYSVATHTRGLLAIFGKQNPGPDDRAAIYRGGIWRSSWEREAIEFESGESPTSVGIHDSGALFAGTSQGRLMRRDDWYGTSWREVFRAPAGTFQPVVQRFTFAAGFTYVGLKGVLLSEDNGPWRDVTSGLGDLPGLEQRGRFGVTGPVVIGDRLIVGIGGLQPLSTGIWVRAPHGAWSRLTLQADVSDLAADGRRVVALRSGSSETHVSDDAGASWRSIPAPEQLVRVVPTALGFVARSLRTLYVLDQDRWWPAMSVGEGTALAATGREIAIASAGNVKRLRIETASSSAKDCGYETALHRAPEDVPGRACLTTALASGTPARYTYTRFTVEGDPVVLTLVVIGPSQVRVILDSADGFGRPGVFTATCTSLSPDGPIRLQLRGCTGDPEVRGEF